MGQATGYASVRINGGWYDLRDEGNQSLVANLLREGFGIQEYAETPYHPPKCDLLFPHVPHGAVQDQHGDYRRYWFSFPRDYSTTDVVRWLRDRGVEYRPTRCYHAYDCCSQWYSDGVWITRKGSRTLAVINWGRNV